MTLDHWWPWNGKEKPNGTSTELDPKAPTARMSPRYRMTLRL
jgi:hypothetical protein